MNIKSIYDISAVRGNIRGKSANGFVRPTIKQYFTSTPDFEEIEKISGGIGAPFIDDSPYSAVVTLNSSASDVADSPFTNGTISRNYTAGIADQVADNAGYDTIGSGDFTIEWWGKTPVNQGGTHVCIQKGTLNSYDTTAWIQIFSQNPNGIALYLTDSSGAQLYAFSYTGSPLLVDEWFHIAIVRTNGTIKLYRNGEDVGLSYPYSQTVTGGSDPLYIGNGSGFDWTGRIALLKISKEATYTTAFTPSTNILDYDGNANTLVLFRETVG